MSEHTFTLRLVRRSLALFVTASTVAILVLAGIPDSAAAESLRFTPEITSGASGGLGSFNVNLGVEGTEYGGFPEPVIGVVLRLPVGTTFASGDHQTCSKATLEQTGPEGCFKTSAAGPVGRMNSIVSFGSERVEEAGTVESFYAPGGGLNFFIDGHTPTSLEILASATIAGNVISVEVPLVSTVPGAPFASITELVVPLGETQSEEEARHLQSGLTLPAECSSGRLTWTTAVTLDEEGAEPIEPRTVEAAAETGCSGAGPLRRSHEQEAAAARKAEEEAATKKKAEDAALAAELAALRAAVKRLEEELHASVRVERFKVTPGVVTVTVRTSEPGRLTITGPGLKRTVKTVASGTHQLVLALTRAGKIERKERRKVTLVTSLRVHDRTVFARRSLRL